MSDAGTALLGDCAPILITDSSCDLPSALVAELGLEVVNLRFTIDGDEFTDDFGATMSHAEFYGRMRRGSDPTTAAVPLADYLETFTRCAESGRPALLIGLAGTLSSTYEAALTAAAMVADSHPDSDIRVVESINASAALGLLVLEAARLAGAGAGIDELEDWVLEARTRVNGYFTLETLEHLRRGGRISGLVAHAGTMLDVRPVLRIDGRGALVLAGQSRGRRRSMRSLVDAIEQRVVAAEGQTAVIAHGDAAEDAELLRELLVARVPFADTLVTELGPVMAAHAGPGMLAIACFGKER